MTLEEWKECAKRGTSGDMVIDILSNWQSERDGLKSALEAAQRDAEELLNAFRHAHGNRQDGTDICKYCGLDLRNKVHLARTEKEGSIDKEIKRRKINMLEQYAEADEGASCEAGGTSVEDLKKECDEIRNKSITLARTEKEGGE